MKIFVDENIPSVTVQHLRVMGHDVLDIRKTENEGIADETLWSMSFREGRLLVTTDKGFTHYREQDHHGILIIALRRPNRQKIHQRILDALTHFTPEQWKGLMVVMRDVSMSSWRKGQEQPR